MAQLIVRNLDPTIAARLQERARRHGVSAEEEHRRILRAALTADVDDLDFKSFLASLPDVGWDELFQRRPHALRQVDL